MEEAELLHINQAASVNESCLNTFVGHNYGN